MGKTISEKIISEHAGHDVKAGDFAVVKVDLCFVQDGTGPLAVRQLHEMGISKIANPGKTIVFLDHAAPSPRTELSNDHIFLRTFAKKSGAILSDINEGVCHQIVAERFACPGFIIVGADSHTCTAGALGTFSTGMGSTDVAAAIGLGKTWLKVPQTYKIVVNGEMPKGVYSKDLILELIGKITADGATYKALEFCGDTIKNMPMSERLTLTNMAVEAGAKTGIIASDSITKEYLDKSGRGSCFKEINSDSDAHFEKTIEIDAAKLYPMVAMPHTVDNVKSIDYPKEVKVDQVFIGSCTNARIEDLRVVAKVWEGKKKNPQTRVIITPASKTVYAQAVKEGLIEKFIEFGASVTAPGCGVCVGVQGGVLGDNEVCVSTSNRNFLARMGNPKSSVYLVSPASAAAASIAGRIVDPREYL